MDPSTDPFTAKAMKRDELAMLDNAFTTLQNEPPYVIDSRLVPMASQSKEAFSRGSEGDYRNELYIVSPGLRSMVCTAQTFKLT